jgi:uncharacterized protein YlzI (FlbEa/FlbD family)
MIRVTDINDQAAEKYLNPDHIQWIAVGQNHVIIRFSSGQDMNVAEGLSEVLERYESERIKEHNTESQLPPRRRASTKNDKSSESDD